VDESAGQVWARFGANSPESYREGDRDCLLASAGAAEHSIEPLGPWQQVRLAGARRMAALGALALDVAEAPVSAPQASVKESALPRA
jgi:hypothetical protein